MSFEDDLHRIEGHVAEARRLVQQQKGFITRLRAAGVDTWDAQKIFRFWNRTFSDLRNTETASGQACGDKVRRPG
jgi:hypothetical protein